VSKITRWLSWLDRHEIYAGWLSMLATLGGWLRRVAGYALWMANLTPLLAMLSGCLCYAG